MLQGRTSTAAVHALAQPRGRGERRARGGLHRGALALDQELLAVAAAQPRQRRGRGSEQLARARRRDRGRELRRARDRLALELRGDEHVREVAERRKAERGAVRDLLRVERS